MQLNYDQSIIERLPELSPERRAAGDRIYGMIRSDRKQVGSSFNHLANLRPFEDEASTREGLKNLCESLNDYVALVHFGAFKRILDGEERRHSVRALASSVYPEVERTTEVILSFNERYQRASAPPEDLSASLVKLGRSLTKRVALENRLLFAMTNDPRFQIPSEVS